MVLIQEENFPRGGKKAVKRKLDETTKEKRIENLFSTATPAIKKKKKDKHPKNETRNALPDVNSKMEVKSVDILSYEKILDGTLLLSCVHSIHGMTVQVGLPGRTFGDMTVKHISDSYLSNVTKHIAENNTEELSKMDLSKLFTVGQMLPVKVLLKEGNEKGYKVYVSTNPKDINSNFNHMVLEKGMVLWASVQEKSDHCYILDVGIKHCRVVLPFSAVDKDVDYIIGQPLWCHVRKCNALKEATTLTVSTKKSEIDSASTLDTTSLQHLIPGMKVEFEVDRVIKNGIIGKILDNFVAHVNELYLKNPLDTLNNYSQAVMLKARVLYIEPITNFVKLTLRDVDGENSPSIKIGALQTATIIANSGRGLSLKLSKHAKGFVTYKRILNTLPHKENSDMGELIEKKYPIGSNHQCRILCYNYMEMEYICTFESGIIKEEIFADTDLQYGPVLQGKISKIQEDGIEIKVGNVTGFIPNIHICNSQFSRAIKSKFKVGQTVKTKLFERAKNSNRFTLKQALLESDLCLSKFEDAKVNERYPGVVVKITNAGALILFYGGVKGWLVRKLKDDVYNFDPKMFYEGQVIQVTVKKLEKNNRMTLSLDPPKELEEEENSTSEENETKKSKKKRNKKKKSKATNDEVVMEEKQKKVGENKEDNSKTNKENKKRKMEVDEEKSESDDDISKSESEKESAKIPGMGDFFNINTESVEETADASSDEEPENDKKPKKIKLKPEEVRRKVLQEEENILKTEIKLANESSLQTPIEIEKALVSDPHNSKLWVLYIATLTTRREIEKARAIVRKALESIPLEKVAERLNIWVASLNLENTFGDDNTFDAVFSEAIVRNDSLKVHLVTIDMLMESKKFDRMEDLIKTVLKKFKQNPEVYLKVAKSYYSCRRFDEARKLQNIAIKYVKQKKEKVDLLVQFGLLEFKYGESDFAESVFERILQTDPTRTDVWCTYADQLVTKKKFDFARQVFTRAANTKLPLKKTKVILAKFHSFEKMHGSPQHLEDFKKLCLKFAEAI